VVAGGLCAAHVALVAGQSWGLIAGDDLRVGTVHFFWMNAATLFVAVVTVRSLVRVLAAEWSLLDSFVAVGVVFCGVVVILLTGLGLAEAIGRTSVLVVVDVLFVGGLVLGRRFMPRVERPWALAGRAWRGLVARPGTGLLGLAMVGFALVVVGAAWRTDYFGKPPLGFDDLTYHLTFPVTWLQKQRLVMPAQPYGDPSPMFYPINAELLYLWLMVPFGVTDFAVKVAPFAEACLVLFAVLAAARSLGARRAGMAAAVVLVLSFPFLRTFARVRGMEGSGALGNDRLLAAFAACAVAMVASGTRKRSWGAAGVFAAAVGLMAGTKFLGVVFAVPLALIGAGPAVVRALSRTGRRRRALAGMGACAVVAFAVGGFAYCRNLILLGNPVYPAQVRIAGRVAFDGPRTRATYQAHPFHNLMFRGRDAYGRLRRHFGWLWEMQLLACVAGALVLAAGRGSISSRLVGAGVCLAPAFMAAAFLALAPYRIPRLLYPAAACLPISAAALVQWLWDRAGARWARKWAPLGAGLPGLPGRAWAGATLAAAFALCAGVMVAGVLMPRRIARYQAGKYERYSREAPVPFGRGWQALNDMTRDQGATVAYSAMNVPYPLFGERFQNRVLFVPRNRHVHSAFFGFESALEDPTGVRTEFLLELRAPGDVPEYSQWKRNLAAHEVELLFVAREGRDQVFPLEAAWAERLVKEGLAACVYSDRTARIYSLRSASAGHMTPHADGVES